MDIWVKVSLTGVIFFIIGMIAILIAVTADWNPPDSYKIVFGLCILGGAPATLIGLIGAIWA